MPELRSRARKAAAAEAAPAAKPAPKRKTAKKPPKTQGGSKKTKTADKPMSGDSPIPAVGAAPAAAVPPSPNEKQALEDDPNTVNAEAQAKPPPQPRRNCPSMQRLTDGTSFQLPRHLQIEDKSPLGV